MADSAWTARQATREQVEEAIKKLNFPPRDGPYSTENYTGLLLGIKRITRGVYNPGGGEGMAPLLRSSTDTTNPSQLSSIKSTDTATVESVLQESKDKAAAKIAAGDADAVPAITTRGDAMDAADRITT